MILKSLWLQVVYINYIWERQLEKKKAMKKQVAPKIFKQQNSPNKTTLKYLNLI